MPPLQPPTLSSHKESLDSPPTPPNSLAHTKKSIRVNSRPRVAPPLRAQKSHTYSAPSPRPPCTPRSRAKHSRLALHPPRFVNNIHSEKFPDIPSSMCHNPKGLNSRARSHGQTSLTSSAPPHNLHHSAAPPLTTPAHSPHSSTHHSMSPDLIS